MCSVQRGNNVEQSRRGYHMFIICYHTLWVQTPNFSPFLLGVKHHCTFPVCTWWWLWRDRRLWNWIRPQANCIRSQQSWWCLFWRLSAPNRCRLPGSVCFLWTRNQPDVSPREPVKLIAGDAVSFFRRRISPHPPQPPYYGSFWQSLCVF